MNILPVLTSHFLKINYLHSLKNTSFHDSSKVQNNDFYVEHWLEKKFLFEIYKM